ncbi:MULTISPECIES: RDD family protein [Streptomyces]|uniref:RDD family protein n=1 Tax=Streptomyces solicathayae TaxID=3081768 RepID=A0ABZ0LSV1_9ACTN|nr:RDD family protein [Streptomyces sp. HUAS YS2]WOX22570.1 RDD family protein [Streptomyces sp. HUAS YS2]
MSFGDPNNPYGQQQPPQGQPGYGYPQQQPQQPGVPPQQGYGYPQQPAQPYGAAPQAPGTLQANNGYINVPVLGTVQVATMGARFGARLIDAVIYVVVYFILSAIGFAGAAGAADDINSKAQECAAMDPLSSAYDSCMNDATDAATGVFAGFIGVFLLFGLIGLLYEWLMVSFVGATVGKMALGLRVVKESTGQVPGIGGGFIRWIIPIVGSIACGIGQLLVYVSPFFDNSGKLQGWHDRAAGTIVIKK